MKSLRERLEVRRQPNRPTTTMSIRVPEDILDELNEMAPLLGFSGHESLVRTYIGEGLRRDELLLAQPEIKVLSETLKEHGISDEVISSVIARTAQKSA